MTDYFSVAKLNFKIFIETKVTALKMQGFNH